jgi:hypothetical protein
MRMIRPCSTCGGPVTIRMMQCPHCSSRNLRGVVARAASVVAAFAGGLTVSGTLAACYGGPCATPNDSDCPDNGYVPTCAELSTQPMVDDKDGDGYCKASDCNENDKTINRAAKDTPGDGVDQNCSGRDG